MMSIFEERVRKLTGTTTPMGVKEILLEKRKKEGIEIGLEKGEHKKAIEMAIKLKTKRTPVSEIAELTDLSIAEIESL